MANINKTEGSGSKKSIASKVTKKENIIEIILECGTKIITNAEFREAVELFIVSR